MKQGKMKEAFTTINQATQRKERDAKIWYNYMMISFSAKKYPQYVKSISTLIDLNHKVVIEKHHIEKLNVVAEIYIQIVEDNKNQVRGSELVFQKIEQ